MPGKLESVKLALVVLALHAGAARADDFEDLGNCKEQAFGAAEKKLPVRVVSYERDAKHRITRATTKLSSGTTLVETRDYDDKGRLATIAIDGTRVVNEYDAKTGRLARSLEFPAKATVPARVWTRTYDDAGHLVHQIAKEGDKVAIDKTYTYDKGGRVATMSMDGGATTETHGYDDKGRLVSNDVVISQKHYLFTYRYDDKGRRIEQASPNGRIEYSYDCH